MQRDRHFLISKLVLGLVVAIAVLVASSAGLSGRLRLWSPALAFVALFVFWALRGRTVSRYYGHDIYVGWFLLCCGYGAWITWGYPPAHPGHPLHNLYPDDWLFSQTLASIPDRDLVVTTAVPALCVLAFTLIPSFWHAASGVETRERWYKEIGDNSYYMGFLLTLSGLSSALMGMDFAANDKVMSQAIAKCGAAISTTFVAVICRVVLLDAAERGKGGGAAERGKDGGAAEGGNDLAGWLKARVLGLTGGADCQTCDATATIDDLRRRLDDLPASEMEDIRFRLGMLSRAASRAVRWRRDGTADGMAAQGGGDAPVGPGHPSGGSEPPLPADPVQRQAARVIQGYFGRARL